MTQKPGTIALDFDGPVHRYSKGWQNGEIYDEPTDGALESIREIMIEHALAIHTARMVQPVAIWLRGYGFEVETTHATFWNKRGVILVTNHKIPAIAYIDDREFASRTGTRH